MVSGSLPSSYRSNVTSYEKATEFQVDTTYFVVLSTVLVIPFVSLLIATLYRKSLWVNFDFGGRRRCYDIHVLRRADARTSLAKFGHIICYRHRPLPLEILRTCLDAACLLYLFDYIRLVILLPIWCICDLAQGLHVLSLVYLRHTQMSREAVRLATYLEIVYSLLFGFPLGFVCKLMWVVWIGSEISFPTIFVPMYIAAVGAFVFTLCYMLPTLCWSAAAHGCKRSITRLQVIILLFCYCATWMVLYYNIAVCRSPPVLQEIMKERTRHATKCQQYFISWTTAFVPLSIIFVLAIASQLFAILEKCLLYRFLPEVISTWSWTIVFITSFYLEDGINVHIAILPILTVLLSIIITLFVNVVLITDILSGLRAPQLQPHEVSTSESRSNQDELKRRQEVRARNLQDFSLDGGKTSLKGTLLMHLKKRDRMRQCVVCFDEFIKSTDPVPEDMDVENVNKTAGTAPASVLGIIRQCGHYFHFNCVWDWLQRENNCPLCRTVIAVNQDAIKTVQYDDVRYALERNRGTLSSTVGTVSKLVSEKTDKKTRPSVSETLFKRDPRLTGVAEPNSFVQGDFSGTYRLHTRPTSKHCGVCNKKFLPHRHSRDIVVGYIRSCGHYFHWDCVDRYVVSNERCPTCFSLESRHLGVINEGLVEEGNSEMQIPEAGGSSNDNWGRSDDGRLQHNRPKRDEHRKSPGRDKRHKRRSQTESKRSGQGRHFNPGDSVRGIAGRDDAAANQRAGPSSSGGRDGQYRRNPRSNAAAFKHNVRSDDVLFAFLSDVQRDVQRQGRRPQPSTIHAPQSSSRLSPL